jgi:hypothetical protein
MPLCVQNTWSLPARRIKFFSISVLDVGFLKSENMKKGLFFIAILSTACASVQAQGDLNRRETIYGHRYESQNLRFVTPDKTSTEVEFGALASGGDGDVAYGAVVAARHLHSNGFAIGLQASVTTPDGSQTLSDADVLVGYRFGKAVTFEVDALAGYGQAIVHQSTSSIGAEYVNTYSYNDWGGTLGAQVRLGFRLSKAWSLALTGGFKHNFVKKGEVALPEHWSQDEQTVDANRWSAALSIACKTGVDAQRSGDNCREMAVFGGTSNQGTVFGAEILKFYRIGYNTGTIFGVSSEYVVKNGKTLNRLYGKGGYRFLPWGATSPLTIDLTGAVGAGQVFIKAEGSTEGGEVQTWRNDPFFGIVAKGQFGLNLHLNHFQLGVYGFIGYDQAFKVDHSGDCGYSGKTFKRGGSYCGFGGRISYAF